MAQAKKKNKNKQQVYSENNNVFDEFEGGQTEEYEQYVLMQQLQQLQQIQQLQQLQQQLQQIQYYNQLQQTENQAPPSYYNENSASQQNTFQQDSFLQEQRTKSYLDYNRSVNNDTARMRMGLPRR